MQSFGNDVLICLRPRVKWIRFSEATAGTKLFAKRERTLPSDQFEVRPVQTKRGITMVWLFSAAITRVERDAPYREAIAAKRLARMTRAERRMAQ